MEVTTSSGAGETVDGILLDATPVEGIILDAQQAAVFLPNKAWYPTADGVGEKTNVLSDDVSPGSPLSLVVDRC